MIAQWKVAIEKKRKKNIFWIFWPGWGIIVMRGRLGASWCLGCHSGHIHSPLMRLLVVFHHPGIPMHVDVHGDEANGDCHDVTKDTPCDPTVSNKEDVALVKHVQAQEQNA